jgi:hypothetical protein
MLRLKCFRESDGGKSTCIIKVVFVYCLGTKEMEIIEI